MIPNLREAQYVQSMIDRAGIQDVYLIFDPQIKMWSVNQVIKKPRSIITLTNSSRLELQPNLMFWIKNNDGTYRVPGDQDIEDVMAIVTRAQIWFDKGSDKMIDKIEEQEKADYDKRRNKQSEKIRSYAKPLKKAVRKELL